MACEGKGVPCDLVPARMHSPEMSAIHLFGRIPVMRHDDVSARPATSCCHPDTTSLTFSKRIPVKRGLGIGEEPDKCLPKTSLES
jgi:hypothetical protein